MTAGSATLNLGILAHVDAGKTSLTERLLYEAGVTDHVGRVDHGDTQTDTLLLEQQRGITIRAAVASFVVGDPRHHTTVNLLDTPGHPDFIAEVERVLGVLDGAVLVISAVEGVQAQTIVLMRTLRRLRIPTLIFVNKIDRRGADADATTASLGSRLGIAAVPIATLTGGGTSAAASAPVGAESPDHVAAMLDVLSRHDDALIDRFLADAAVPYGQLRSALVDQTRRGLVHPVLFGSAMTGAGVDQVLSAVTEFLPTSRSGEITCDADVDTESDGELSGTVFKIERGRSGEKIAYVRMFSGQLHVRDRLPSAVTDADEPGTPSRGDRITALEVFDGGPAASTDVVRAGQIARLWGLAGAQIGDPIGRPRRAIGDAFARPTLETLIRATSPAESGRLFAALTELAEQDPLIRFRRYGTGAMSLSLYGEVQQEVVEATLLSEYGIAVTFADTRVVCLERVSGIGSAVEHIGDEANPYLATVGLRVEPGPLGSGARFAQETVVHGTAPPAFVNAISETVGDALQQGLSGWEVTDVVVTLTHTGYYPRQSHSHAQFDKSMSSVGSDFRGLTPLVLHAALRSAGTQVCEPVARIILDAPTDTVSQVLAALTRLGGVPDGPLSQAAVTTVTGTLAVARIHALTTQLPALTHGEGALQSTVDHYAPVRGPVPRRERVGPDPSDRRGYLLQVKR